MHIEFLAFSLHALNILGVFGPLQEILCFTFALLLLGVRNH